MKRRASVFSVSLALFGALVVACGSGGDDSTFGDPTAESGINGSSGGSSGSSGFGSSSGGASSSSGGASSSSGNVGNVGGVSPTDACASSNAGVDAPPIYLVFMVDRSGSMGGGSMSTKWTPAVAALKDFFADPASANIHASIAFFAGSPECNSSTYANPAVPMKALPDATAFAAALDATSPSGGTPTLPAEQGAIDYAKSVQATLPAGTKVAIVLVTDGDPNDCSSTAKNVGDAAATVAATIKTYVVGVGNGATNLDTIATGGGTAPHIQVNTTNAATTSSELRAAIGKIKAAQLGCNYTLPKPPNGQQIDVNAVNVNYTPAGGKPQTLAYSADCSDPNGWHYDSTTAPTQIIMCANICKTLQGDTTGGKVDIIFGCQTAVPPGSQLPGGGVK